MNNHRATVRGLLINLFLLIFLAGGLRAGTAVIPSYFTDNMTHTSTDPAVTMMEQALLDRLNGAVTTIDVDLCTYPGGGVEAVYD